MNINTYEEAQIQSKSLDQNEMKLKELRREREVVS